MYSFNHVLLSNLALAMGTNFKSIEELANVSHSTLCEWRRKRDLPIQRLVSLCNSIHVSIAHFIIPSDKTVELSKGCVLPLREWQDIRFEPQSIASVITDNDMTIKEALKKYHTTHYKFYHYFSNTDAESKMRFLVSDFLEFVNSNNLYPGDYISDFNAKVQMIPGLQRKKISVAPAMLEYYKRHSEELEKENHNLISQIKEMRSRLERLESVILHTPRYGYAGITDEPMSIVAEPTDN